MKKYFLENVFTIFFVNPYSFLSTSFLLAKILLINSRRCYNICCPELLQKEVSY